MYKGIFMKKISALIYAYYMYASIVYYPLFKSITKLHIYIRYKSSIVCSCFCHRCDCSVSSHTNHVFLFLR